MLNTGTLEFLRREAQNAGVAKLMLFGSSLHKPENEVNDIDIAVEGLKKRELHQFVGGLLMSHELRKDIRKQIDVVDLSDNIPVIPIILDEGVVIYEKER